MDAIRWVFFIPGAFFVAWVAWFLSTLIVGLTMSYGLDRDSFFGELYINTMSHAAMGAAFVYAGARIAPKERLSVAYGTACLGLVLGGFLLFPAIITGDGWAIWGGLSVFMGIGAIIFHIKNGQTDIDKQVG